MRIHLIRASGTVSTLGNNTLITPTAGRFLRLFYVSYNPKQQVTAAFRFGAGGALWLKNDVVADGIVAKDFGDFRCVAGAIDEALILNLSLAVTTNWNTFYLEV